MARELNPLSPETRQQDDAFAQSQTSNVEEEESVPQPTASTSKRKEQKGKNSQGSDPSLASTDSSIEPSIPSVEAFSQLLALQETRLTQVLKQSVTEEGRRLEAALGRSMEKAAKANANSLRALFQEENAKHKKLLKNHTHQLTSLIANGLVRAVTPTLENTVYTTIVEAFQETLKFSLEASVIPALEMSCKAMFEQVDSIFQQAAQHQFALRDALNSASSITQTLNSELADGLRKLLALAVSQLSNGPLGALHEEPMAPLDPTKELSRLISERKYDEAFNLALQKSDVSIVSWLCSQVDLQGILSMNPIALSQEVMLSLLQQLSCDINLDTLKKLSWMRDISVAINPSDPMIVMHVRSIFEQVYQRLLAHRQTLPATSTAELSSIRVVMHLLQNYSIPVEEPTFAIHPPSKIDSFLDSLLIPDEEWSQEYSESIESSGESILYEPPPTVEPLSESTSRRSKKKDEAKTTAITEKWLNHYSSGQRILLVGEGDFSFSASLAVAFGTATDMVATSLNSREFLDENYKEAPANIEKLTSRGCKVIHGVDVRTMAKHPSLNGLQFDRLIFNFPHAGFKSKESPDAELSRHKKLIKKFLANGKKMINKRSEIHITHKCNKSFLGWDLELLAKNEGLMLKEEVKFDVTDYPGYNTKYGFGGDKNFNCYPSKTYKFALESPKKSKSKIDIL